VARSRTNPAPDQPAGGQLSLEQFLFPAEPEVGAPASASAPAPPRVWTVKSLVASLTRHVERQFSEVRVEGEISNCKPAPSGHIYFTLKDGDAQISTVIFRSRAQLLRFRIEDGLQVQVRGRISVYESRGQMQLIADSLEPIGDGAFRLAFDRLRERLQSEGLFDAARKLPIPAFAARIGIITSPTGAVIQDILNILDRRHRPMQVQIFPATVQGPTTPAEFRAAIEWFHEQTPPVDVIVLARGGGSLEDLHAFNNEALARTIAAATIPIISAIGHETDFTIADFVADLRAPTPSAAAEIITDQHVRVEQRIAELDLRVERAYRYHLAIARQNFSRLLNSPALQNARDLAARSQQHLDQLCQQLAAAQRVLTQRTRLRLLSLSDKMLRHGLDRTLLQASSHLDRATTALNRSAQQKFASARQRIATLAAQLSALSPHAVLERGYAVVYTSNGALLRDAAATQPGEVLTTRLARGQLRSTVIATEVEKGTQHSG
jgi:exodeoxyribonuclease VII large subunit